jgi:hypothetical protein
MSGGEQRPSDARTKAVMKNPHAVALGRLGGAKGGPARAKALSPRRRSLIAKRAATARARSMSAAERQRLARRAAAARWSDRPSIVTASEAPAAVRRLLRKYDPDGLRWRREEHRYLIVREILLRGDHRSLGWLRSLVSARRLRDLVRSYRGAGCDERERQQLRRSLRLTTSDIPVADGGGPTKRASSAALLT